jgi:hypothetical protein
VRRLSNLLAHLPRESSLAREMGWWWTDELELLAMGNELAHAQYVAALGIAGLKKAKLPKPLNIPRPRPSSDGAAPPPPERSTSPMTDRAALRAALSGG